MKPPLQIQAHKLLTTLDLAKIVRRSSTPVRKKETHTEARQSDIIRHSQLFKMTIEFPSNEREISDAEWQQVKQEAQFWTNRIYEHKNVSRSYGHILYNLRLYFHSEEFDERIPDFNRATAYKNAVDGLGYIKRYFKLLEDFPEFAEKELKPGEGYFPELMNELQRSNEFVDAYEAKLRGVQGLG